MMLTLPSPRLAVGASRSWLTLMTAAAVVLVLGSSASRASEPPMCSDPGLAAELVAIARESLDSTLQMAAQFPDHPEIKRDLPLVRVEIGQFTPLENRGLSRVCSAEIQLVMGPYLGTRAIPVEYLTLRTEDGEPVARLNRQKLEADAAKAPTANIVERLFRGGVPGR